MNRVDSDPRPDGRTEAPRSIRWCAALAFATIFITLAVLAGAINSAVGAARNGGEVQATVLEDVPAPDIGGDGLDPDGTAQQQVTIIDEVDGAKAFLTEVDDLYGALVALACAALAFTVFRRADVGRPFDRRNVRDLRILALVIAIGVSLLDLVGDLAMGVATDGTAVPAPEVMLPTPFNLAVLVGLGLWALSAMFEYGADLADDSAATI